MPRRDPAFCGCYGTGVPLLISLQYPVFILILGLAALGSGHKLFSPWEEMSPTVNLYYGYE